MSALKLVPAVEENFFKDRCFADQRVAGANPFQLWRVTNNEGEDINIIAAVANIFIKIIAIWCLNRDQSRRTRLKERRSRYVTLPW